MRLVVLATLRRDREPKHLRAGDAYVDVAACVLDCVGRYLGYEEACDGHDTCLEVAVQAVHQSSRTRDRLGGVREYRVDVDGADFIRHPATLTRPTRTETKAAPCWHRAVE